MCALQSGNGCSQLLVSRLFLFVLVYCISGVNTSAAADAFTGSAACQGCHEKQHTLWRGSDHDLAMQLPHPDAVLGNFDNASFTYNGITTRFFRDGDKYMVNTDGEDGALQDFEVAYVFGYYPLQQYLLPLSRGRLQALSIAYLLYSFWAG